MVSRRCIYPSDDECAPSGRESVVIVEPVGRDWHVSGWHFESGDLLCRGYAPERADPWERHCKLHIPTVAFLAHEAARRSAE